MIYGHHYRKYSRVFYYGKVEFAWKAKNGVQVELPEAQNSHTEVFIHLIETKMIGGSAKAKNK